jgi:sec-independent protein translocase protein TatC
VKIQTQTLSFLDHLDELRGRVLQYLFVYIVCCLITYPLTGRVLPFLIKPVGSVIFSAPGEAFSAYMLFTLIEAFILSLPVFLYHAWAFAWEALTINERKYILIFGPLSLVFFLSGGVFAYFVIAPIAITFLFGFSSAYVVPMINIKNYISFIGSLILSFGVVFELPLILMFLVKIGIASPAFLRYYRKHAIFAIFVLSAILTPPDVVSQILMAVPLIVLYELGIVFSNFAYQKDSLAKL